MTATSETDARPAVPRRILAQLIIGGFLGGLFGYFVADLVLDGDIPIFAEVHFGAFLIAAMLFVMGLFTVIMGFNDRMLRASFQLDADEQDLKYERRAAKRQGSVLVIAGLTMMFPAVGPAAFPFSPAVAIALLLLLTLVETYLNWTVYREGDEFARRILAEVSVLTFWVFQMALFIWASLEVFGFAPVASALDILTGLMVIYLMAISVVGVRRGVAR